MLVKEVLQAYQEIIFLQHMSLIPEKDKGVHDEINNR